MSLLFCGSLGLSPHAVRTCATKAVSNIQGIFCFAVWFILCEPLNKKKKILHLCGNAASRNEPFSRGHGGEQTEVTSRLAFHPVKAAPLLSLHPTTKLALHFALAALSLVIFSAAVQSQMLSFPAVRQRNRTLVIYI